MVLDIKTRGMSLRLGSGPHPNGLDAKKNCDKSFSRLLGGILGMSSPTRGAARLGLSLRMS